MVTPTPIVGPTLILAASLVLLVPTCVRASGPGPEASAAADSAASAPAVQLEIDSNSRYAWRGVVLSAHEVVQPSVAFELHGLTLSAWGNLPVREEDTAGLDEVDLDAAYEFELGGLTLEAAALSYLYPRGLDDPTAELQLTASRALAGGLGLSLAGSADVVRHPGSQFASLSLTRELVVAGGTLSLAARVSHGTPRFVSTYLADDERGLDLAGGTVSFEIEAGGVTLRPHLDVDRPLGASRELVVDDPPIVFGFSVGRHFGGRP